MTVIRIGDDITMQAGDHISFGGYNWRVLHIQNDTALVITEKIIAQRPYHDARGEITWADCALRTYLNGEFYGRFTGAEQSRIIPVTNKNPDNEWYGAKGGVDTRDHIFLLSVEEAVCQYFGDSSSLLYHPGRNQRYWFQRKDANNIRRRATFKNEVWWWWLRSPGRNGIKAVYVHGDGNIGIQGNGIFRYSSNIVHPAGDNTGGVRPALWLRL